VTRNAGASIFMASEDEWYKAAYYDAGSGSYFDYPAGSDVRLVCAAPGPVPDTANCSGGVGDLTDVGSFTASASPYGTFDQGGNVWEWNETIFAGSKRGLRGGGFFNLHVGPASSLLVSDDPSDAGSGEGGGFRVASIPEPGTGVLLMTGLAGLAALRRRLA
jgi:formylglycine-generating enzyme required for sulfatase activity